MTRTWKLPSEPRRLSSFIDGAYLPFDASQALDRVAPSHGITVSRATMADEATVEAAIASARTAFDTGPWPRLAARDRAVVLNKVADLIQREADELALIECLETGKPITQAKGEVSGAAGLWRHAAALASTTVGEAHNTLGEDMLALVVKEPIGVVSLITPWNFPFWILGQKLPFALAAGCTSVVKPSEFSPSTTALLGQLLNEAGVPAGVCNIVLGLGDPVGRLISTQASIDMVSFTGSTATGKRIARQAADNLKKVCLELGGKNPLVVFNDANLDAAADALVFGAYFNGGQCCNASSRAIVQEGVAQALQEQVIALSKQVVVGDPLDPATQMGPMVHAPHRQKLVDDVAAAVAAGATLALGGEAYEAEGLPGSLMFQPTVLTDVTPDLAVARKELFGPILTMLTFADMEAAVAITNDVGFGLSAGVYSENVHTCLEFARRAQAGTVWTNTWMDGFPEVPFGGMKQSGLGREIGRYGLEEFMEVKSVVMRLGQSRPPWIRPS